MRPFTATVCILMLTRPASAAPDTASIKTEIVSMPAGTSIELRLKNKQKVRGARGAVSDSGFTPVDARSGERQIAFDDMASVKPVNTKSHTGRNILIGVGIGVGAVAIVIVALAHSGGFMSFRQSKCEAWGRAGWIPSGNMRANGPGLGADSPTLESRLPTLPA